MQLAFCGEIEDGESDSDGESDLLDGINESSFTESNLQQNVSAIIFFPFDYY